MLKIAKNGLILHEVGSFGFSRIFFTSPLPHPTSSPLGTDGDRKFWVPLIKNLEKKTLWYSKSWLTSESASIPRCTCKQSIRPYWLWSIIMVNYWVGGVWSSKRVTQTWTLTRLSPRIIYHNIKGHIYNNNRRWPSRWACWAIYLRFPIDLHADRRIWNACQYKNHCCNWVYNWATCRATTGSFLNPTTFPFNYLR